mmetsp:Transcript_29519/g.88272  ORF Transcript_29519/g.88272 Transcript_29519/m.88272 type:complete len:205 (-) Transcript_29519:274-888(-)
MTASQPVRRRTSSKSPGPSTPPFATTGILTARLTAAMASKSHGWPHFFCCRVRPCTVSSSQPARSRREARATVSATSGRIRTLTATAHRRPPAANARTMRSMTSGSSSRNAPKWSRCANFCGQPQLSSTASQRPSTRRAAASVASGSSEQNCTTSGRSPGPPSDGPKEASRYASSSAKRRASNMGVEHSSAPRARHSNRNAYSL